MGTKERKYMACEAAIQAWFNCTSPSRAIQDVFDDDGLTASEEEIMCGLEAIRVFKASTGATAAQVAANCAGL